MRAILNFFDYNSDNNYSKIIKAWYFQFYLLNMKKLLLQQIKNSCGALNHVLFTEDNNLNNLYVKLINK
jgi:hypothetical protein